MKVRFFGQYLLEKGLIDPEDLREALKIQTKKRQYFGAYALRLGYLDVASLNELLRVQKHTGKRIGDLAAEKKFLTKKQVQEILTKQKNDHIFLGEVLVSSGILNRENLYHYLSSFHEEVKELQGVGVPEELPYDPLFHRLFQIFGNYLSHMLTYPVKLLDGGRKDILTYLTPTATVRCIHRDATFRVTLTCDSRVGPHLVKGYVGKDADAGDSGLVSDILEEILNISVGNFLTYAQQMGEIWELEPPITLAAEEPILPLYGNDFHEVICASPQGDAFICLDIGGEI